jgi:hypothetical protein
MASHFHKPAVQAASVQGFSFEENVMYAKESIDFV